MSDSGQVDLPSSQEGGWWSSWLTSAKEKSVSALSATKRDLAEFVAVLGTDTKIAISDAGTNIKGILEKSPSTENEDSPSTKSKAAHCPGGEPAVPYDRCQAEFFSLQNNPETYTNDPTDDGFSDWCGTFDVQAHQAAISSLLVSCSNVRSLHARLVPGQVSYEAFWMRYFYKVQLMEQEESRRAGLMERAKQTEEQLKWDDDFEEIEVPNPSKHPTGGHQRSESSSDSFVEIMSALGAVEEGGDITEETGSDVIASKEQGEVDKGYWELLDALVKDPDTDNATATEEEEGKDATDGSGATLTRLEEGGGGGGGGGEGGKDDKEKEEDSNSDWEQWDD